MWVRPKDQRIVGQALARARQVAGYTQQELAKKLAKPQSFVSAYERGQRRIDVLELIYITHALGEDAGKTFKGILAAWAGSKR